MNVLNTFNSGIDNDQIISDLNKMITIKYYKLKNKNKTSVTGIFDFISEKDAEALIKIIKKRLGCSGMIGKDSDADIENKLIFSGNHIEDIKNILLEKKITDESHIKVWL